MKTFKFILSSFFMVVAIWSCTNEDLNNLDFLESGVAPSDIDVKFGISQDNTGIVTVIPTGVGASKFEVYYGDNTTTPEIAIPGQTVSHKYAEGVYTVKIVGAGITGLKTEITKDIEVSFIAPVFGTLPIIENDKVVSKKVNVTITNDVQYAVLFDVYFVEDGIETILSDNIGNTVSYTYAKPGTYSIKVVLKGGAIETTEYVTDFEVTEILTPLVLAPVPSDRHPLDYISIFSDKFTNKTGTEFNPWWWQATVFSVYNLNGNEMLKYANLNYQGTVLSGPTMLSEMEYVHLDVWTADSPNINFFLISASNGERLVKRALTPLQWSSFDIPLSEFTSQDGFTIGDIKEMKFESQSHMDGNGPQGTIFIDNIYFYKKGVRDDFEGNGTITTWSGDDCGINTNFANPFKEGINLSNTVLEYKDNGGTYANIRFDSPDNFDLKSKSKFTLKLYVPSSSITGTRNNQIVLKLQNGKFGNPWETQTEIVKTIVLDQWQIITFDFATDPYTNWWSITEAPIDRTDLNRVVIQLNEENNSDLVTGYIDDVNYHN